MCTEDFENATKLKTMVSKARKAYEKPGEVLALVLKTFGMTVTGKSRRKALMKLCGLLTARRERVADLINAKAAQRAAEAAEAGRTGAAGLSGAVTPAD